MPARRARMRPGHEILTQRAIRWPRVLGAPGAFRPLRVGGRGRCSSLRFCRRCWAGLSRQVAAASAGAHARAAAGARPTLRRTRLRRGFCRDKSVYEVLIH